MLTAGPQRTVPVRWRLSGLARGLVTLALGALVLAVITRRAEFAGIAAPALLLLTPRHASRPAAVGVTLTAVAGQVTETEQSTVLAKISGHGDATLQVRLHPAAWIAAGNAALGNDGWYRLPFRAERWGLRAVGMLEVVLHDRWGLAEGRVIIELPPVTCLPLPARLESLVVLSKLPVRLGEHAARATGEGVEFAGVREFVPGDRQRRINWPATTRRGTLQLNTFAAERAQVTVILMDVSTDVGTVGTSTSDLAVRATAGIAAAYLAARDRVGLISFGRQLRWITPSPGRRQADRIMTMITVDYGDGEPLAAVTRLPSAALPPGALIVVVSPLLSLRLVEALRELRERGFATIVLDVLCTQPEIRTGWIGSRDRAMAGLARRLWRMEQDAIRFSLRELGIPVTTWDGHSSLDEPFAPYSRRVMVNRG
ncbi:MAG: DUF58 domain-containing protein [Streptosporangiaceae bacterium]